MTPIPPITFPALSIGRMPQSGANSGVSIDFFVGEDDLSTCTKYEAECQTRQDMLLADSAGRFWRIVEVKDEGIATSGFWGWLLTVILFNPHDRRLSLKIVEEPALSFEQFKDRVCDVIAADPEDWLDPCEILEQSGAHGHDHDAHAREMLEELLADVRKAKTVRQILAATYDERFDT